MLVVNGGVPKFGVPEADVLRDLTAIAHTGLQTLTEQSWVPAPLLRQALDSEPKQPGELHDEGAILEQRRSAQRRVTLVVVDDK